MVQAKNLLLIVFAGTFATCFSTDVKFLNYGCSDDVQVYKVQNNQPSQECTLPKGKDCKKSYDSGTIHFMSGSTGKTRAEISFNVNGKDAFGLVKVTGFDTPLEIKAVDSTHTVKDSMQCMDAGCKEERRDVPAGKMTFEISFCPP